MRFSKIELKQLFIAWIMLSIAFGIARSGIGASSALALSVGLAALTVGVAFIVHELSHKFVAQKYGCAAEFRADYKMLIFALITSLFGVILAAPGAVMIGGRVTKNQLGRISVSGPLSNLILAVVFLVLDMATSNLLITLIASYGFWINSLLALFNMIPFGNFDGRKVRLWNKKVFWLMLIISALFTFGAVFV